MPNFDILKKYQPLIDNWESFCAAHTRALPTHIWGNPLRTTLEKLADILKADNIPFEALPWYPGALKLPASFKPGKHWAFLAGLYQVQEASAMLPVLLLDPQPGERILDLCAAPGNKTAQIAVKLANSGTVVANDINFGRMRAVRQTLERLSLVNVSTTTLDGANFPNAAGQFDRILVDVPCSCQGTARKDSGVLQRLDLDYSVRKGGLQKALLKRAVNLCKPGGRIVYATCTYPPEENELIVNTVLQEYNDTLELLPAAINNFDSSPGLTEWNGQTLDPQLVNSMRVWPHQNDTGGFFIAVFRKKNNADVEVSTDTPPIYKAPEAARAILDIPQERFGFPATYADPYTLFEGGSDRFYLANPDHHPPQHPKPDASGMMFIRMRNRYPKLSTAAAILLGPNATRNIINVNNDQVQAYMTRQDFDSSPQQCENCTGMGYVLIRYRGYILGVALYRPNPNDDGGIIESMFPKGWSF